MVAVVATTGIEVISTLIVMMILMQILKTMSRVTSETKTFFKMLKLSSTFAMFRCCMYLHLLVVLVLVLQRCMIPIHVCWFGFDGI